MALATQRRVMIVDPIAARRKHICGLLLPLPDIEVVGIARDGQECIHLARVLEPETILFDPDLSFADSLQTFKALATSLPAARIILLTASSDTEYLRAAMLAGARHCLSQPPKGSDLVDVIRRPSGK
jgi:DNA-binding NarL/FixJ family response regulator